MKFNKQYIKKIISEEIKNAIGMTQKLKSGGKETQLENLRKELINLFIKYRDDVTSMRSTSKEDTRKNLERDLGDIKTKYDQLKHLDYVKFFIFCVHILEGHATGPLITFIKTIARGDRRFGPYQDKLDAYDHSITPELEKRPPETNDPDPGFMRVPIDTRKDRKNLTQTESNQLDEGLLKLAREIGEFIKFTYKQIKEFASWNYEEAKKAIAEMNLTHDKATKAMEEWKNMKQVKIMFDEDPEIKDLIEAGKAKEAGELMVRKGNLSPEDQTFVKNVVRWMRTDYLTGKAELAKLERRKKATERNAEKKEKKRPWRLRISNKK